MSTQVEVDRIPPCDFDEMHGDAAVDGRTIFGSSWANMCPTCFKAFGVGLGTGFGQRLILREGQR